MVKSLLILAGIVGGLFLGACVLLYLYQDELLFFGGPNDRQLAQRLHARRIEIPAGDAHIEGWLIENAAAAAGDDLILYFGGNAEDVLHTAMDAERLSAKRLLVTNYPGFGGTTGKPSEIALFRNALLAYDYAVSRGYAAPEHIVAMGRSLGSGVATYVAANRPVRRVVLITPFDSIVAVAGRHYPIFPVRLLLKHRFASDRLAPRIRAPVLIVAAEADDVIPSAHARQLFDAWAGPKEIHVLPRAGHNDIERHSDYYALINNFIRR
jgi:uncharacterized protein